MATLDNLHAKMSIDTCAAGKDVYVEKPMTSQPLQGLGMAKLSLARGGYRFLPGKENAHLGEITSKGWGDEPHMANWSECTRSRKQPNADVLEGDYSTMACDLVNIVYKQNSRALRCADWDLPKV